MIANLPLLFCNGNPTGLANISTAQLERFITFMVTCSWGHDTVREILQPAWWPGDVEFSYPFVRPRRVPSDWDDRLKRLVRKCYDYHKSAFLIAFSAQLSRYRRNCLRYVDNRDHTTSLYHKTSGRLLVTFRNENLFYDKGPPKEPPAREQSSPETSAPDIYLCDHCDSHFDNPETLRTHERLCNREEVARAAPECSGGLPEFLAALDLRPAADSSAAPEPAETSQRPRHGRTATNPDRTLPFPFSSLAGRRSIKPTARDSSLYRERVERYCCTVPLSSKNRWGAQMKNGQFSVRYRRPVDYWRRRHTFTQHRRKELLDVEGQLLLLRCRPVRVRVERMSLDSMHAYMAELRAAASTRAAEDIEFVAEGAGEGAGEAAAGSPHSRADPLEKCEEVIDLCSDDEAPSVKENSDPRAGVACVVRGGAVLRRTAATPQALPAEPCGAARRRPAAVLQPYRHPIPHPVILFTQTLKVPIISLD